MNYELHLTVPSDVNFVAFATMCLELGGKPLLIYVPGAQQCVQPMFSYRFSTDNEIGRAHV